LRHASEAPPRLRRLVRPLLFSLLACAAVGTFAQAPVEERAVRSPPLQAAQERVEFARRAAREAERRASEALASAREAEAVADAAHKQYEHTRAEADQAKRESEQARTRAMASRSAYEQEATAFEHARAGSAGSKLK
jgi:hypothetical protein